MFFQTSPFEARAEFMRRSVCPFPEALTLNAIEGPDAQDIWEGLAYFRQLLMDIYGDIAFYRTGNALESYHRLTDTVLLLYTAGQYGVLHTQGAVASLLLEKSLIRKHFKKPASFPLTALERYYFYFEYTKKGLSVPAYGDCDAVRMHCESCAAFLPALAYLCARIPAMDSKKDYALGPDLFLRADYATILLNRRKSKADISPLSPEILNALGERAYLWEMLLQALVKERGLNASIKFWSYCTPHWIIRLMKKGKPACIFTLHTGILLFEMNAPYVMLEALAREKDLLPPAAKSCLEAFGCIGCGKCAGENMTTVNGISLCQKEAWARRLAFEITSEPEAVAAAGFVIA